MFIDLEFGFSKYIYMSMHICAPATFCHEVLVHCYAPPPTPVITPLTTSRFGIDIIISKTTWTLGPEYSTRLHADRPRPKRRVLSAIRKPPLVCMCECVRVQEL